MYNKGSFLLSRPNYRGRRKINYDFGIRDWKRMKKRLIVPKNFSHHLRFVIRLKITSSAITSQFINTFKSRVLLILHTLC